MPTTNTKIEIFEVHVNLLNKDQRNVTAPFRSELKADSKLALKIVVRLAFIVATGVALFGGCQAKRNPIESTEPLFQARSAPRSADCNLSPLAGGSTLDKTYLQKNIKIPYYFDKPIDQNILLSLRLSSGQTLWRFLQSQLGIKLFTAPSKKDTDRPDRISNSCDYYFELPSVAGDMLKRWNETSASLPDTSEVLGLYLYEYQDHPHRVASPHIIINEKSTKWTMFHEMLHHLYAYSWAKSPQFQNEVSLREELSTISDNIESLLSRGPSQLTDVDQGQLVELLKRRYEQSKTLHIRTTLEEVAVESTILKLYSMGEFGIVLNQTQTSLNYILNEARPVINYLDAFFLLIQQTKDKVKFSSEQRLILEKTAADILTFKKDVADVVTESQDIVFQMRLVNPLAQRSLSMRSSLEQDIEDSNQKAHGGTLQSIHDDDQRFLDTSLRL